MTERKITVPGEGEHFVLEEIIGAFAGWQIAKNDSRVKLCSLKLTAKAPENGWLEGLSFLSFWG